MERDDIKIKRWLKERREQFLFRSPKITSSPQQPRMVVDNREVLSFCSNDYLGLANHPKIRAAFKSAVDQYGVGSGSAHLVNGHSQEHHMLEQELAEFTGRDSAVLFSTGYMANLGVVSAFMSRGDFIYSDRLNHASLVDAVKLSSAKLIRYPHNDMSALQRKIENRKIDSFPENNKNSKKVDNKNENKMILTDSVFSMDGDLADIAKLVTISQHHNAWLMLDDAHGFGVLGKNGAGIVEEARVSQNEVPLLMATLGKAVGTAGAFIAGSYDHIDYLKQVARTWIYTTAMPPAIAAASRESLQLIKSESWRREKLAELIALFRAEAKQRGIQILPSSTAIQPVLIGSSQLALSISQSLLDRGILVTAIRPPTVPNNTARLRITLSANHVKKDVYQLLDGLEASIDACKIG